MSVSRFVKLIISSILCIIAFSIYLYIGTVGSREVKEITNIYTFYDTDISSTIPRIFKDNEFNNSLLVSSDLSNADIIMSTSTEYKNHWKNTGTLQLFYSPTVLFFPDKIMDKVEENFTSVKSSFSIRSRDYYNTVDFEPIITALLNSSNGEIDLSKLGYTNTKGTYQLAIPDKANQCRELSIKALVYMLSNGSDITEENAEQINLSLKKLVSNAVSIKNINAAITKNSNYIFVIPEYAIKLYAPESSTYPIYYNNCYAASLNIFYNTSKIEDYTMNCIFDLGNTSKDIFSNTYFRNGAITSKNDRQYRTADYIKYRLEQDNLADLIDLNI